MPPLLNISSEQICVCLVYCFFKNFLWGHFILEIAKFCLARNIFLIEPAIIIRTYILFNMIMKIYFRNNISFQLINTMNVYID